MPPHYKRLQCLSEQLCADHMGAKTEAAAVKLAAKATASPAAIAPLLQGTTRSVR